MYWFFFAAIDQISHFTKPVNLFFEQEGKLSVADFICFYEAGKLALLNAFQPKSIYNFQAQLNELNQLIAPFSSKLIFAIPYPPQFYMSFSALANFDLSTAYRIWLLLSLSFGSLAVIALAKSRGIFNWISLSFFYFAIFVSIPSQVTLTLGQLTWFNLGLISCFCLFYLKKRDLLAGVFLALSLLKPTIALFIFVYVIVSKRWKLVLSTAASMAALSLASLIMLGWQSFAEYVPYLVAATNSPLFFGTTTMTQVNIHAIASLSGNKLITSGAAYLGMLLGLGMIWFMARKQAEYGTIADPSINPPKKVDEWGLAMSIVIALFCSPHTHYHDCLLLAVSAALTLPTVSLAEALKLKDSLRLWSLGLICYALLSFIALILSVNYFQIKPLTLLAVNIFLLCSGLCYILKSTGSPLKKPADESLAAPGDHS